MNKIFRWRENNGFIVNLALLAILIVSLITNQILIAQINRSLGLNGFMEQALAKIKLNGGKLSGDLAKDAAALAIAQGAPEKYGAVLGVSFEQVQASMNIMKEFDPTYGKSKIILTGDDLKRYIDIGLKIACEYCCGAKNLVSPNGEAACGCAHSQAMRGLAAYLIKNNGAEYTNDQILRELARWKGRYFPKQMMKKVGEQLQSGQYTADVAALLLDMKLPKYSGQSGAIPLPSDIKDAPGMVGGC